MSGRAHSNGEAHAAGDPLAHLDSFIRTCPVIDNHGHNLLLPKTMRSSDLLAITSEADGEEAQAAVPTSLAHLRAARLLRSFHGLAADANWAAICAARTACFRGGDDDGDDLVKRCLAGTQTILIDDGYQDPTHVRPYGWHDKFTRSPCKRLVRIETVAADLLEDMHRRGRLQVADDYEDDAACAAAWAEFTAAFDGAVVDALRDPDVVGFKSVVCYMTGLDVDPGPNDEEGTEKDGEDGDSDGDEVNKRGLAAFQRVFLPTCVANEFDIEAKGMNDALVVRACRLIGSVARPKPMQFHTGLGSNSMSLVRANPAYLQPLIAAFPRVPIVLLHTAYPFTREAAYLASVYANCHLDLGLVWFEISRRGQEAVVAQALELAPWAKLLWSTDGHDNPETYWLAGVQGRDAVAAVLRRCVADGDLTAQQALAAARDLLFENSNRLYALGLDLDAELAKGVLPLEAVWSEEQCR